MHVDGAAAGVAVPTLVIAAERDPNTIEMVRYLADHIADAQFAYIRGASHFAEASFGARDGGRGTRGGGRASGGGGGGGAPAATTGARHGRRVRGVGADVWRMFRQRAPPSHHGMLSGRTV